MTAEAVDDKVAIVARGGRRIGSDIELHIRAFFVNVTDDRQGAIDGARRIRRRAGVDDRRVAVRAHRHAGRDRC